MANFEKREKEYANLKQAARNLNFFETRLLAGDPLAGCSYLSKSLGDEEISPSGERQVRNV